MKHKVLLTGRAKEDRQRAYDWFVANYSIEFAQRWFSGINEAIESLADAANRCSKALENDRFSFNLHELLHGTKRNKHCILFTIQDNEVVVLHIRHSAQDELTEDDL